MSSSGTQKIRATAGREHEAGNRYAEIKDIIAGNSSVPFKDVIMGIAGIDSRSYNNYIRKGYRQYGAVSQFTVNNLSSYFGLPKGIFDCTMPFSDQAKEQIAEIIAQNFSSVSISTQAVNAPEGLDLLDDLKAIAIPLSNENDRDVLEKAIAILERLVTIARSRHETLTSLTELDN
jgi:hypothetical protein